jgi:putative PEP-CTERM system histidine kinase
MNVGGVSYGLCAAAFWVLLALLLGNRRGRAQGVRLVVAVAVSAVWATLNAWQSWAASAPLLLIHTVEIFRHAAWILVLTSLLGVSLSRFQIIIVHSLWMGLLAFTVVAAIAEMNGWSLAEPLSLFALSGIALSIAGLVLLEQLYRNATQETRGALRYFVIGVGLMFAYDLFLYSQTELLRGIAANAWNLRGAIVLASAPMLALAVRNNPQWSLDVFVSRHIVFYTSTFVAIGLYLMAVALGGYYVRAIEAQWSALAQLVFFVGAAAVLVVLLTSGTWQRRIKVFISKHFYRNKYDYRIEWLRFIDTLSSARDVGIKTTAIRAVAQIFGSPSGVLYWQAEAGKPFMPLAKWPEHEVEFSQVLRDMPPLDPTDNLAVFLAKHQWIIDLQEYRQGPDLYQGIRLPEWMDVSAGFRIVSPLFELDRLVGFIVLSEPPPPFELTYEDRDLLKTVGRHVATHIAQYEASRQLIEGRQLEAYSRLTAFVMHDLKNAVAQLRLLVQNAARHRGNPAFFDDAMATISNTVDRMTKLIEQLRGGAERERNEPLKLIDVLRDVVARCADRQPVPTLHASVEGELLVTANREQLTNVMEHVLRNAQDATSANRSIALHVAQRGGFAEVAVEDEGAGMDLEFIRDRLFRPFDSTKGSRGMGIGAYQVREYILSLGGAVNVHSIPEKGTRFSLSIPLRTIN